MAKDFTLATYRTLLRSLSDGGYSFSTVAGYRGVTRSRVVILRHDVDALPLNSLLTAKIENESGIAGTYYFRYGNNGFERDAIISIAQLGHETGYHYEDMAVAGRRARKGTGEYEVATAAYRNFMTNLEMLRGITQVSTACMHGSPLSRFDSRLLWKYFDYRELGIVAEPYMDISFDEMLYLTDTGRRWDGSSFSVRDKAECERADSGERFTEWKVPPLPGTLLHMTSVSAGLQSHFRYRSTFEIIKAAYAGMLPDRIMITVHPQRWHANVLPWTSELLVQNAKNAVKYFIVRLKRDR